MKLSQAYNTNGCIFQNAKVKLREAEAQGVTSCSSKTDNISQELDFMDVVAGFFVVQIMALYDKKWHDEYFSNVVTAFFVVQLMALHESEVLSGVPVEELDGKNEHVSNFHSCSLAGGGIPDESSEESMSPPKKRRSRGKGPLSQVSRRRKTRKSTEATDSQESLVSPAKDETVSSSPGKTDRRAAWKNSPQGKSSIAESNKKYRLKNKSIKPQQLSASRYEATEKARSTRARYEANEGTETRARYEANEGTETRARYEANEGTETRARYEDSIHGVEARRRYNSSQERLESRVKYEHTNKGLETRRRYKSSQGRIESRASYEDTLKGLQTRIRYNSSQEASEIRKIYGLSKEGTSAKKRALQNFQKKEVSQESLARSRKKYESKEAARIRRIRYKQNKLYNSRVRKAIQHLTDGAAKTKLDEETGPAMETEPADKAEAVHHSAPDQSDGEPVFSRPGLENLRLNKDAMATIRSHKVGYLST